MSVTVDRRPAVAAAAILSIAILAIQIPPLLQAAGQPGFNGYGGIDYRLYMDATAGWRETGLFYLPHQLEGPYQIRHGDILYPPVAILLFLPFLYLPAALWWAIPLLATLFTVVYHRPAWRVWPFMAACVGWQPAQVHVVTGNPVIWAMAAMALGTIHYWPSVLVLLKPSLGLFAVFGARHRSWWKALLGFAAASALFLPMWTDWLTAIINSRGGGLAYSWQEIPMLALPIIAWLGRPGGRYGERRGVADTTATARNGPL